MKFDGILLLLVTFQQTFLPINLLNQESSINLNRSASTPISDLKIVGGDRCPIEKHPYVVSIRWTESDRHKCGGSLVSSSWVLTAAHCCPMPYEHRSLSVRAGTSKRSRRSMKSSMVYDCHQHPDYDNNNVYNDIALLHLEFPIKENKQISYVKLANNPNADLLKICSKSIVMGWGDQYEKDNSSNPVTLPIPDQDPYLHCVELPVVNQSYCQAKYDYIDHEISDTVICAYSKKKDACQGDSGGPLVCSEVQYGIVSLGIGCAYNGIPGVYTRVDKYQSFIHNTMKRDCAAALYANAFIYFFICMLTKLNVSFYYIYYSCGF